MSISPEFLWLFVPASLAINFYPGPNNLFSIANAARFGLGEAMRASLGRQAAFALLIAVLALGLGALFIASPQLFRLLKLAGAGFLVWLGIKMFLRDPPPLPEEGAPATGDRKRRFMDDFAVAFANPKPVIVLLPFLPKLIMPGHTASLGVLAAGGLFLVLEATAALTYALGGLKLKALTQSAAGRLWLSRAGGLAVLAAAVLLVTSG